MPVGAARGPGPTGTHPTRRAHPPPGGVTRSAPTRTVTAETGTGRARRRERPESSTFKEFLTRLRNETAGTRKPRAGAPPGRAPPQHEVGSRATELADATFRKHAITCSVRLDRRP